MAQLKSGLALNEGENLVMELEAEFFAGSSNPIAQFIGNVQKFILKILGTRLKGHLVITDQRVVEVYSYVRCYIFNVSKTVKCLLPSSIKEAVIRNRPPAVFSVRLTICITMLIRSIPKFSCRHLMKRKLRKWSMPSSKPLPKPRNNECGVPFSVFEFLCGAVAPCGSGSRCSAVVPYNGTVSFYSDSGGFFLSLSVGTDFLRMAG